jgi:SAM-dependent methyltransferase
MEPFYPLHAHVCDNCFLVQLQEFETPNQIFGDYVYFSSYSDSWVDHARRYVDMIAERLRLTQRSQVVEIASNDGYLLQFFAGKSIPALGIEPAANVAQAAIEKGIRTRVAFFGASIAEQLVAEGIRADLVIANNVLAHVPALNDFVRGLRTLLAPAGVVTAEFPHLLRLLTGHQFDTIYHEHFSYFSLFAVEQVFARHQLRIFDVEELSTHGGSLRIYAQRAEAPATGASHRVKDLIRQEKAAGLTTLTTYLSFSAKVAATKRSLLRFLINARDAGESVVGYGAPAKGNTLLNFCGVRTDFIDYVVDKNPHKQGLFLPGTHIPILHPNVIRETRPNYLLLHAEISEQMAYVRDWGGRFVTPVPEVKVHS